MTTTGITWRFTVTVRGASASEIEDILDAQTDSLMDELLKLEVCNEQIHDPSVGAELATSTVEILLLVDAPVDDAVKISRDVVRTAIHAAGGSTPKWDDGAVVPAHAVEYEPETAELSCV
jgi:hypothetical protein